jgi:hypothetical protein
MNNKGVAIHYGDVAPEAKENFKPSASEKEYFVDFSQLQKYNLNFPNYANPCELYQTVLDGTAEAFPSNPERENMGFWSRQLSDDDGNFSKPIYIYLKSQNKYSSQGLTFTFDTHNNIFPKKMRIRWQRTVDNVSSTIASEDFYPDSAFYFCKKFVENYDELIITFYSLNMPKNRLKLRAIDYGYGTIFFGNELRNTKIIQSIDPISSQININTADFVVDSKTDMEYSFQSKQPLSIYFNGQLKETTFVKSSKRNAKFLWRVESESYIGLMDGITYVGGMYKDAHAVDILEDIFEVAKVPYNIDPAFDGELLTGYIPFTTCRNALMQVAFAIQAVVDTSNSDVVKVMKLENETKQTITLDRIMQGQNFDDEETVTGVEISAHAYTPSEEVIEVYNASESGAGTNIFVKFPEPLYSFGITNGTIISSGTNYAIINANDGCVFRGKKYSHTTEIRTKNNPLVLANDIQKKIAIENATLVSSKNVDNVLNKCYNWLVRTKSVNLDIVEGKHIQDGEKIKYGEAKYGKIKYGDCQKIVVYDEPINVGDVISAETEYLGNVNGRIIKQNFSLGGNIIIKKAVLK